MKSLMRYELTIPAMELLDHRIALQLKVTRPKQLLQKALALNEKQEDDYKRKKKLDKEKVCGKIKAIEF